MYARHFFYWDVGFFFVSKAVRFNNVAKNTGRCIGALAAFKSNLNSIYENKYELSVPLTQ